jgi:hypothetical protein
MLKLFMYALIHHPKVVKDAQGNETQGRDKVVEPPGVQYVMAKDEKEVHTRAATEIPPELRNRLEEVEILVRPF